MRLVGKITRSLPLFLSVLLGLGACETSPPVQEMSDARQAIEVARHAGAADRAKPELSAALLYLEAAEHELGLEEFGKAKHSALQAKTKAFEALDVSESSGSH
jgi:Domain of unknown function (DUF4398)